MSDLYSLVNVHPLSKDRWRVTKGFWYRDVYIHKGFETDGATVPRMFWSLFPPNRSDYFPAVVVHDYLCQEKQYKKADNYFAEIMRKLEIKRSTVFFMVGGTRFYHLLRYKIWGKKLKVLSTRGRFILLFFLGVIMSTL